MPILLRSLRFIDSEKTHSPKDYVIVDHQVLPRENSNIDSFDEEIDCSNFLASEGWVDLRCASGEPGEEQRETIESLGELLANSGFAKAVVMPNAKPVFQNKNDVQFFLSKTANWLTEPILQAALTKDALGEDFTDILDLNQQGINVFGDGVSPLSNPDRLMKALQYLKKFDGILFDQSYDPMLAIFGQMHEGIVSTRLGMKGIPNLAEDVCVQRNVEICKYTGGRLHFQTLSSAASINSIRKAKSEGLSVTADVSLYQLLFTDEDLVSFDTNYKVVPPFRSKEDRTALIEGLKDGTIDAIVSNHQPMEFDAKHMEFDLAQPGMIGLQTFLPGMVKLSEELGWPLLISKITSGPKSVLGLEPTASFGSLTIFDPKEQWAYNKKSNLSLSANHPWIGSQLQGKVKMIFNKGKLAKF
ncbi:Dihydroorotase [Indibacter alkaliphilus LW1]|uniref:Dihydroorotase n=1 Tax=Indibacter alkaliphilus (strain CCUG 57479 / KCTC 22604 / LW1) TaxID=1189612 RepID=S2CZ32_INDAL|nr:dihydroorotase [Indibacter alkaliphilus]EOZ92412.1 Dihydroorotase [Indibacter alkaliphilus LW1]